jgi:cytochrome c oxidase subunit 4
MAHATEAAHEHHGTAQYYWVWIALLVLTVIEIVLAYRQVFQPFTMLMVLLVLSVVKAGLIIFYFMHLKFEITSMKVVLMGALLLCLLLMTSFFPDAMRVIQLRAR